MGTALQTPNPRVSDVLASILQEAPVGLTVLEVDNERQSHREISLERGRYTSLGIEDERKRRREYVDPLMGQRASVTTCYCVHGRCSWLFLLHT